MSLITCDFETHYDKEYSLSNMTTEEYIRHPNFEVIGVGIKVDDGESVWFSGEEVKPALDAIDWKNSAVIAHNMQFDGTILAWIYGHVPAMYFDTFNMARPLHSVEVGGSLKALAEYYGIGAKGDEVIHALGKHLDDFSAPDLAKYGRYCKNDCDLTYKLFNIFAVKIPEVELRLIDITLRMFIQPEIEVDDALLVDKLVELRAAKSVLLQGLMGRLNCSTEEEVRKKLSSNPQFATLLKELGVQVPMKISPTTNKLTYALAKNDLGFIELQANPDPFIQQLCAIRLGVKSTAEETRIDRFIGIGARNKGKLPIPLRYYAAHTGRWGGLDAINMQNLPSRVKSKRTLKNSLRAPQGHVLLNADSSQIEARKLAWWAGQDDVVALFASGQDVYSHDATIVYGRPITRANELERFVGKTMRLGLGYGTGPGKLQHLLKTSPPGTDIKFEECQALVNKWRSGNKSITDLWKSADLAIHHIAAWPGSTNDMKPYWLGRPGVAMVTPDGIKLSNGFYLRYPNLRQDNDGWVYDSRKGPQHIWGGVVVENIVQGWARNTIGGAIVKIHERYSVRLTVHDSIVCIVKENDTLAAVEFINQIMSTPDSWCTSLPLACEVRTGITYGDVS